MSQLIVCISAPLKRGKVAPWPSTNDYIHTINVNRYAGNAMKRKYTDIACVAAQMAMAAQGWECPDKPVAIEFIWQETSHRRDLDNIRGGAKFVLDGLVQAGAIKDDSQRYVSHLSDSITVNKDYAGVVVVIETGDGKHE